MPSPASRRAAEQRDDLAAFHSITSSARASSAGGTSRPSAFAVLRFITRSNWVGCSTGKSAGLAPSQDFYDIGSPTAATGQPGWCRSLQGHLQLRTRGVPISAAVGGERTAPILSATRASRNCRNTIIAIRPRANESPGTRGRARRASAPPGTKIRPTDCAAIWVSFQLASDLRLDCSGFHKHRHALSFRN